MKLYFAGAENNIHFNLLSECNVKKMLQSYYFLKGRSPNPSEDILLDSGAFSAHSQKIEINLDEYCEYLKRNNLKNYACLDVIGDGIKTFQNQKYMESRGLNPIPTYHLGEDKKFFEKLVNEYEYIGLGGMVHYSTKTKIIDGFLSYCFNYILKNKLKTKIHGRGMTNPKFMKRFPFYSVDSTGWLAPQMFNRMVLFKNGELVGFTSGEMRKKIGVDFGKIDYKERNKISIRAYLQFEEYCTKLHQVKGLEYWL